ncbi:hypothetical protein FBU31_003303, partial [Coemansia sp. 'formosensis']
LSKLSNRFGFYNHVPTLPMELRTDIVNELVQFIYQGNVVTTSSNTWVTLMARRSAATLQFLRIVTRNSIDISDLIQDSYCRYVRYLCLTTMVILLEGHRQSISASVASGVILFPNLRQMKISDYYSFDDDAPFRGNAYTLEQLKL